MVAVIVTGNEPMAGAVPERTPAGESVTVPGRPAVLYVGAGEPLATTLNVPATPAVKVVVAALEKAVGTCARFTVKLAEIGVVTVTSPTPHVPSPPSTSTDVPEIPGTVLITYELAVAAALGRNVNVASN